MKDKDKNAGMGFTFNWGTGIVVSFVLFCSFIIYIVVRAFQQDIDLVSETYYKEELAYQDRIEERTNLAQSGLKIELSQNEDEVMVKFPEAFKTAAGEIYFYHPSRELFDKRYQIALNDSNLQSVAKSELVKGNYKVKIKWKVGEVPYFQEARIFLK